MDHIAVSVVRPIPFLEKSLMEFDVPMKVEVFDQADSVATYPTTALHKDADCAAPLRTNPDFVRGDLAPTRGYR
jgi:hypothetical protein